MRGKLLQMLLGGCESTPLALVTGSVATSDDDVINKPEEDKSISGLVGSLVDAGRRTHSLDWNVERAEKISIN